MAERRMFAKSIVLSDAFLDMRMSARCLYFTLGMLADDDGFVGNPKSIMRQCGASQDDMAVLLQKRYILGFESGIIVIKHWRINNYLRNDRYQETTYLEEKNMLKLDGKSAYTESGSHMVYHNPTNGIPSIGKDSIGKDSIGNISNSNELDCPPAKNKKQDNCEDLIVEIVNYLNFVCNKNYKHSTNATKKHINARLREGYIFSDFKKVIDTKHKEWSGTKMEQYLRPETLFGTKFESYLNQTNSHVKETHVESKKEPTEEMTEEEFLKMLDEMPPIDWGDVK